VTIWIDEETSQGWDWRGPPQPGAHIEYSAVAIGCLGALRCGRSAGCLGAALGEGEWKVRPSGASGRRAKSTWPLIPASQKSRPPARRGWKPPEVRGGSLFDDPVAGCVDLRKQPPRSGV